MYNEKTINVNPCDELYHYGVLGMKWGVRRYQNKDGSLTPSGEKRYYNDDGSLTRHGRYARDAHMLSYEVRKNHLRKLHESKAKKEDDPELNYHGSPLQERLGLKKSRGKKYIDELSRQLKDGYVTSFVEDSKGRVVSGASKTKKGVVIRDKDGNRITSFDYEQAQRIVSKHSRVRIDTGRYQ